MNAAGKYAKDQSKYYSNTSQGNLQHDAGSCQMEAKENQVCP